jgi:hypothetical protein
MLYDTSNKEVSRRPLFHAPNFINYGLVGNLMTGGSAGELEPEPGGGGGGSLFKSA